MDRKETEEFLELIRGEIEGLLESAHELEESLEEAEVSLLLGGYDEEDGPKGLELVSAGACESCIGISVAIRQLMATGDARNAK